MALKAANVTDRVRLLGWSEPYDYKAGSIEGTSFPAGTSMRVCVGTDEHDFTVLKVKTHEVFDILSVVSKLPLLAELEIVFEPSRGQGSIARLLTAKSVASVPTPPKPS